MTFEPPPQNLGLKLHTLKRVVFTVTNDLIYDQRMTRICTSMVRYGYAVTLVGNSKTGSPSLPDRKYHQKRIPTIFKHGFGFYAEYNFRLFFFLLFTKADILCCIDLDTMLPVWLCSKLKNTKRVYDAHEYFSQQKEIMTRPGIYKVWKWIEKTFLPEFIDGYTVSQSIVSEFAKEYGVHYKLIRNLPVLKPLISGKVKVEKIILYQGAVNEARGLEFLIPAMRQVNAKLLIYGDGNFLPQARELIDSNNLQNKVFLKSKVMPGELDAVTQEAYIGLNLVENNGLNQYYSLANKFFDYIQNALPQVTMNFPEYKRINDEFEVAILISNLERNSIVTAINHLLDNNDLHQKLSQNCLKARDTLNWQNEEKKLIDFYNNIS